MKNIEIRCQHCNELLNFSEDLKNITCPKCGAEWAADDKGQYQPSPGGSEFFLETEMKKVSQRKIIGGIGAVLSFTSIAIFFPMAAEAPGNGIMAVIYFMTPVVLAFAFILYGFGITKIKGVDIQEIPDPVFPPMAQENKDDNITKIQQLAELHQQGILTAEEFQAKKEELLKKV